MFKRFVSVLAIVLIGSMVFTAGCTKEETIPEESTPVESGQQEDIPEGSEFVEVTEKESQEIAEAFVRSSATFSFDGLENTLVLTETMTMKCPYCWTFVFEYDSSHGGYGDRTGMILTQAITPHRAVITVVQGQVTSAILDDTWDILEQEDIIASDGETAESMATTCVSAIIDNPVYETTISVEGEVSLLGELLCPCFELSSCGESIHVWYGLMVENDGTEKTDVSIIGIKNGDTVVVTGVLKDAGGIHYSEGDFWAERITPVD